MQRSVFEAVDPDFVVFRWLARTYIAVDENPCSGAFWNRALLPLSQDSNFFMVLRPHVSTKTFVREQGKGVGVTAISAHMEGEAHISRLLRGMRLPDAT